MPSHATPHRQRTLGGVMGLLVLAFGLAYHFLPGLFQPGATSLVAPRGAASVAAVPVAPPPVHESVDEELNAGPPLTLAPTAVIAARLAREHGALPRQLTPDPPRLRALLERADKALAASQLGGDDGAAALFLQATREKPDSRRAAQGLIDVRARLVAQAQRDVALGNAEDAQSLLAILRPLPDSAQDVMPLESALKALAEVRPLLAQAAGLLRQGKVDAPAGHSALDVYRQVQQRDPRNAVAEQGILDVQHAVLDRALAAVAHNDFAAADKVLAEAQAIRPGSQQWRDVAQRVQSMRSARASGVLAQAHSALDAGNLELAGKLAAQARTIMPSLAGLDAFAAAMVNARLYAGHKPGQVFTERYVDLPGQSPAMVVIPTGSFAMGAGSGERTRNAAEQPQHTVTIAHGFAMARSAITVGQFREFVQASGYVPDAVKHGGASVYDERSGAMRDDTRANWQDDYAGRPAADNLPVVNVSWNDAKAYADWLSQRTGKIYRLPSEAEFAYALRAGTTTYYWWGNGTPAGKVENLTGSRDRSPSGRRWNHAFADYGDGYWGPAPVMSFAANPFGLYDMGGNVSEWVADCWHDNYIHAPMDGSAWLNPGCSARVLRGGSWGSSPDQARSAWRQGADAGVRSGRVGFRVVREL